MFLSLVALAASAASSHGCHSGVLNNVVRDNNPDEPFVITTTIGAYRLGGQDFIHPRLWRPGERLQICAQPGPGGWVNIKNRSRSEQLDGQIVRHSAQLATIRH